MNRALLAALVGLAPPMPWLDTPSYRPPRREQSAEQADAAHARAELKRERRRQRNRRSVENGGTS